MASKTESSKKNRRRKPLVQGRLVLEEPKMHNANDDARDPTISPRKSVPKLTEDIFPQAEPPSKYLDLSDEEGEKEADLPQPVLVCDASHLAVSPDGTEVDQPVLVCDASHLAVFA
ncbi:hypothetical protein Btru_009934 [Bulinus truncatus]|nr:hypothetical protein Btru_009934 [Bulinus truncatus]